MQVNETHKMDMLQWILLWFAALVLFLLFLLGVTAIAKTTPYLGIGLFLGVLVAAGFILHDAMVKA